jgi:cytochrome b6-f complex iron-sulfur subunit
MKRKAFIGTIAASIVGAGLATGLITSCNKDSTTSPSNTTPPSKVDFTLDLDQAENAGLKQSGGSKIKDGVIVAHASTGNYVALSVACTHTGCPVGFNGSADTFPCPCHGSKFDINGNVLQGPASSNLKKYNTTLNGSLLRVFE